jgi:hypothetical protein
MLLGTGWSLSRIALVQNTVSSPAAVLVALLTGLAIRRIGRRRTLLVVGVAATTATAALIPLSRGAADLVPTAAAVIALTSTYTAILAWIHTIAMDLTRPASAASDYTAQVSMLGVLRLALGSAGLAMAAVTGFPTLIVAATVLTVVGMLVTLRWTAGHTTT